MEILETIYESYISGKYSLVPEGSGAYIRPKFMELIKNQGLNEEQVTEFEEFLFAALDHDGKKSFFDGFKLAMRFMSELSANTPYQDDKEDA